MATLIVTRHAAAVEWLRPRIGEAIHKSHLTDDDIASLGPDDVVVGTLPMHLAAAVCARGAKFWCLTITTPPELRGKELSLDDLGACDARIVKYIIKEA